MSEEKKKECEYKWKQIGAKQDGAFLELQCAKCE